MPLRILPGLALLAVLALAACTLIFPLESQRKDALDDFVYALRWQLYPEAAACFSEEHREPFLTQFEGFKKNLTITDVRQLRVEAKDDGRRAEVRLEMDYYLLPSATIKTLRIDQTWVYFEEGKGLRKGFVLTTRFPEIPGESSQLRGTLPP